MLSSKTSSMKTIIKINIINSKYKQITANNTNKSISNCLSMVDTIVSPRLGFDLPNSIVQSITVWMPNEGLEKISCDDYGRVKILILQASEWKDADK